MKSWLRLCFILVLACLSGCTGQSDKQAGQAGGSPSGPVKPKHGDRFVIAVIPKAESHEFWKSVRAGALKAGQELNVEVQFKGPASEKDTGDQIAMVRHKIAEDVDGICLAPVDAHSLRPPVEDAINNHIPVVIFDSGLTNLDGVVSFVATNNERGGRRAAEYLYKIMKGPRKNVILMRYNQGSQSTELREKGFLDKIKSYPDVHVLVENKNAGASEGEAVDLAASLLSIHGQDVDGIFCPNQPTASGMLTVLTKQFPEVGKRVKFVGFDSGTNIARALENGQMDGTILQDPVTMGYLAVKVMVDHLNGKPVAKENPVPEELATPENLKNKKIHSLLYPETAD